MDTYSFLRQFADSWVLLAMTLFFLGVVVWAFRPGSRALHDDSADIPFRNETTPANQPDPAPGTSDTPKDQTAGAKE